MATKAEIRAEAQRLLTYFEEAGAQVVEADILQPADILLDLYGEDIRARAFITTDHMHSEQMLRPDFTVPVVQMHMADGAEPARYAYAGEVFRSQDDGSGRSSEYLQVGYEVFERDNPAASDAEVFALIYDSLAPLGLRAATGDIGILMAAVRGLTTTDRRKAALLRHIWRPRRFRALLDRFGGRSPVPPTRLKQLQEAAGGIAQMVARGGPHIGMRSQAEIAERLEALVADAAAPPIPENEVQILDDILSIREKSPFALENLRDIAVDLPSILPAVTRMNARLDALQAKGVDVENLDFEASYGRTTLEYYDGFVFGFYSETRLDMPPVASGGRYDALTRVLGQGKSIPAVGGVIRPELVVSLKEAQA